MDINLIELLQAGLALIPGMPKVNLDWLHAFALIVGLMMDPEKLANLIVTGINKFVPKPFKSILLQFLNKLSKGIDRAIPDKAKSKSK